MSAPTVPRHARERHAGAMHERFRDRRRAVRDARHRTRRRRQAWTAAAVVAAAAAAAVVASPVFAIADVVLLGVAEERQPAFLAAFGLGAGDHLLTSDLAAAEARGERLPWVASVDTRRRLPGTLDATVLVREPVAVVRLEDAAWLVDRDGVVVAGGSAPALPVVAARGAGLPGLGEQTTDPAVLAPLAVLEGLPADLALRVERVEARGDRDVWLDVAAAPTHAAAVVRVGAPDAVEEKARAVSLLLEGDGRRPGVDPAGAVVDVRAPGNPVLVPAG